MHTPPRLESLNGYDRITMKKLPILFICSLLTAAPAAERVALVIGNSGYKHFGKLDNPKQDHDEMARVLSRELGFTVDDALDLDAAGFKKSLADFASKHTNAREIIFYFSGHGMQVQGENYLLAVDSNLDTKVKEARLAEIFDGETLKQQKEALIKQEAERNMVSLSFALQYLERMGAENAVRVVILDCCRDNPIGTKSLLVSKGLTRVDPPSGTLIAFAAREGQTAGQTEIGNTSLYTRELIKQMRQPGVPLEKVFKQTRAAVVKITGYQQVPAEYSLLTGDMFFMPPGPVAPAPSTVVVTPVQDSPPVLAASAKALPAELPPSGFFSVDQVLSGTPYASYNAYSKGKVLLRAQEKLKNVGLYKSAPDGAMGRGTQEAIMEWQRQQGLPVTGRMDAATQMSLSISGMQETAPAAEARPEPRATPKPKAPASRPVARDDFFKNS